MKKSPRYSTSGKVLILGALLTVTLPGIALAATTVTVRTPGSTTGPGSSSSEITTHADCQSGELISGMGIDQTIGTGMSASNLHVNGISPSGNGSSEYIAPGSSPGHVADDVTHSLGMGGTGAGAVNASYSSTPYGMCLSTTGGTITHTQVIMNSVSAPTTAGTAWVMATCPEGTRLLGGGARTTPGTEGSLKPIVSYPTYDDGAHDNGEIAAADAETNPTSWVAGSSYNGSTNNNIKTYAYAICSGSSEHTINVSGITVKVRYAQSNGPTSSAAVQKTTVGCGGGDGSLISGGAGISGGNITSADFTAPGSAGDHLNGSYPSDGSGNPVSNGTTTAAYWTSSTHTGGSGSTSATKSHSWALCMTGN